MKLRPGSSLVKLTYTTWKDVVNLVASKHNQQRCLCGKCMDDMSHTADVTSVIVIVCSHVSTSYHTIGTANDCVIGQRKVRTVNKIAACAMIGQRDCAMLDCTMRLRNV